MKIALAPRQRSACSLLLVEDMEVVLPAHTGILNSSEAMPRLRQGLTSFTASDFRPRRVLPQLRVRGQCRDADGCRSFRCSGPRCVGILATNLQVDAPCVAIDQARKYACTFLSGISAGTGITNFFPRLQQCVSALCPRRDSRLA